MEAATQEKIKVVYIPIKDLIPSEYNPRKATEKECKDLVKSISEFGLVDPVIVNSAPKRFNIIIGGHFRCRMAKELGIKTAPVVYVNIPDIEKEKELNLRLNKNSGEWDFDMLANFDEDLLEDVGFESKELDFIFQVDLKDDEEKAEMCPESRKETDIKLGDLFQLGEHRLLCGDATKKADVKKLMGGKKADMVFTDPPYNVDYSGKNEFLNKADKGNRIQEPIKNDNIENFDKFLQDVFDNYSNVVAEYNSFYITFSGKDIGELLKVLNITDFYLSQILVWVKNNIVLGRMDYNGKHEFIIYGWYGKHKFYGGNKASVWEFDKPLKNDLHPTMKPVLLIEEAIKNSSKRNDIVLDLFGGSGSTLIAAERLKRKCFMAEIFEIYCQVIIDRWEKYTGDKAVKLNG